MIEHLHQLAVHAYYCGELDVGRRACERLLESNLPAERERVVRRNRTWYTQTLTAWIAVQMRQFEVGPSRPGWSTFNPTIIDRDDGYLAIVRSSNYRIVDGRYVMPDEDRGEILTDNILVALSQDLTVQSRRTLSDPQYKRSNYPVHGFEDCRLSVMDDELVVSATCRDWCGKDGACRIATSRLSVELAKTLDTEMLQEPIPGRHEKNWMPIAGTSTWLYSCWENGRVATVHKDRWHWQIEQQGESPTIARGWRGGSQLIDIGDGRWLALVHEVAEDDGRRIYEHRFVLFAGSPLEVVGWSPAFAFRESRTIEFAAGLARRGDQLVATFGVRDEEAWLAEMSLSEVLSWIGGHNGR